ncbi:hypothetical protein DPEC_G00156940 [Dallia pectoralis]|uniref:Uncharacterized protein n=1 Tax=Dallia pectoralis TaxID=75939 RepID=A0ACC2GKH7_DALPE|nr:hypothetical protein DPEC_G00156940 [Dallia pectoralis]
MIVLDSWIQKHLDSFKDGWNNHGLRTEHNQTPLQLWMNHAWEDLEDLVEVDADYGIDWNGPHNHHGRVTVPEVQLPHYIN